MASKWAPAGVDLSGKHGFDFEVGAWRVHHRRIQADTKQWVEFDGTLNHRLILDGSANLEEHLLNAPSGQYRAAALRSYDAKKDEWSIWWLDSRYPARPLDPAVKGRFENGVGKFYSDYEVDGKPVRGRFIWSHITPTSARWEQAASSDGGKTWQTNWIMELRRAQ
ncbi:MAG: DUF1579 domain-containing protein [Steroidobacteraceae bacterium]